MRVGALRHHSTGNEAIIVDELNQRLAELAAVAAELDPESQARISEILDGLTWLARRVQDAQAQG